MNKDEYEKILSMYYRDKTLMVEYLTNKIKNAK